jgi:hypothetical protein
MKNDYCNCVGLPSLIEIEDDKCLCCGKQFESNHFQEARIIQFKTKVQKMAEVRFRHLADHLDDNPCHGCIDYDSEFCFNECKSNKNRNYGR